MNTPLQALRRLPFRVPRAAKWWAAAAALLVLSALAVIAFLPADVWRRIIVYEISRETHRKAAIDGDVSVHLLSLYPRIRVEGMRLANADWASSTPLLRVRRIDVTFRLWSVFVGELTLPRLIIDGPVADLERDGSGRVNWNLSGPNSGNREIRPLHLPVIQELRLTGGRMSVSDGVRRLRFEGQFSVNEAENAPTMIGLDVRGSGTLNDKAFALRVSGPPLLNVDHSHPYAFDAVMMAGNTRLNTHAEIAHPFDLASAHGTFSVSGNDLADVYYLTGLALPNTAPYSISGTLARDKLLYSVEGLRGTIGSSDIAGALTVDMGRERPKLTAKLTTRQLNLADLAVPLGSEPAVASTAGTEPATTRLAPVSLLLLPDADLQVARVRGMDADVLYEADSVTTAKLPVNRVRFHLVLDDGKLTLSPLVFSLPEGQFSGSVSIDARGPIPKTVLDMQLRNVDLAQFKTQYGHEPPLQGQLLGRIRVHGAGASVHKAASTADGEITFLVPTGQMHAVLAELTGIDLSRAMGLFLSGREAATEIRCGVADFHANAGDLTPKSLTLDTTHVLITGGGHLDLHTEDLDFWLRGRPKEPRLARLRSPITLRGSLLHPKIGLQAGKAIGQAAGATALGLLLTPLAAILAFVDGGLAKDSDCAALLGPAERAQGLHTASN